MKTSFYEHCIEAGRENLIREWHPTKNGDLTPKTTAKTSSKIIWWKCEKGHEWRTQAKSRIGGTGCPECYRIKQEEKREQKLNGKLIK